MSAAPDKCHHCGKRVYHAELMRHEGMIFHNMCFGIWNKQQKQREADERNRRECARRPFFQKKNSHLLLTTTSYTRKEDTVSPAYYRVADPASGTPERMVSGPEEAHAATTTTGGGCPSCGFAGAKGKFCSECGAKL